MTHTHPIRRAIGAVFIRALARWRRSLPGAVTVSLIIVPWIAVSATPALADPMIDFDYLAAGTVVTGQYADVGGPGEGVVFGPLPGDAGDSARPMIESAAGQAHSGSQVASINCPACNEGLGYIPHTTATFAVPRSAVSVYAGWVGSPGVCSVTGAGACAEVTLLAFDSSGNQIASSGAARVVRGQGVNTLLTVSTPTPEIAGFEITAADADSNKDLVIDDLGFSPPAASPFPDFTLNLSAAQITVSAGGTATDVVAIGRLAGSTGNISLAMASGLPPGVTAQFSPDPAGGSQTILTLVADIDAQPTTVPGPLVTITGIPLSSSAGTLSHSITLNVQVLSPCTRVSTAAALIAAIHAGCKHIHVTDDARIDLAAVGDNPVSTADAVIYIPYIPGGVTLESDRSPTAKGGLLYMSHPVQDDGGDMNKSMLGLSYNTRVTGLRLQGYDSISTKDTRDSTIGVRVEQPGVSGVMIDNNEIFGWPEAGVDVNATHIPLSGADGIRITNNYIHNDVQCGAGYGVEVGGEGAYALIDRNVFDFNRHDVAGGHSSPHAGYIAQLNFILTRGPTCPGPGPLHLPHYNQHFDVHGSGPGWVGGGAGDYIAVRDNTIRGDQKYGFAGDMTRPAFDLRGEPTTAAIFADNAVEHPGRDAAIKIEGVDPDALYSRHELQVFGNRYHVNTSAHLAVGDFDGDGCSDVFQSAGTVWVYSPCGRGAWRFLNQSTLPLRRLAFGDFNGDGKTDVFTQAGARWLVSYGATSTWRELPATSNIPMSGYRFADFDGDGKTDIFRANGSRFYYSSAGASPWRPLAASHLHINQVRICDFNGDGKADVFSLANHQWSVSWGGATTTRRLNGELSSNLNELVFADFTGDGRCDIARERFGRWQVSWGGRTPWHPLQPHGPTSLVGTLVGHFDGDHKADILQYGAPGRFGFAPFSEFTLSSAGTAPLVRWTLQNML